METTTIHVARCHKHVFSSSGLCAVRWKYGCHPMLATGKEMINKLEDYSSLKEKGKVQTITCH